MDSRVGEVVEKAQEHQQAIALLNSVVGEIRSTMEAESLENKTWRATHDEKLEDIRKQNNSAPQNIAELLKNELQLGESVSPSVQGDNEPNETTEAQQGPLNISYVDAAKNNYANKTRLVQQYQLKLSYFRRTVELDH